MKRELPPSEINYDDLVGIVSINLAADQNFNQVAAQLADYDSNRFEAIALRVFIEHKAIVTIFAIDKSMVQGARTKEKLPVYKFKKEVDFTYFLSRFKQLNFTVVTGDYEIENMEVIN